MSRGRLLTLSPKAHKAMAVRWALIGFSASGKGFHGDIYDREKYPAIESMLVAHFEHEYDRVQGKDAGTKQGRAGSSPKGKPKGR